MCGRSLLERRQGVGGSEKPPWQRRLYHLLTFVSQTVFPAQLQSSAARSESLSTEQGCSPLARALCVGSCNDVPRSQAALLWRGVSECLGSGEVRAKRGEGLSRCGEPNAQQNHLLSAPSNAASPCRFGLPFVLHLEKTIAWDILQKEILEKMQYFLRPAACLQVRQRVRPGLPALCDRN